MIQPQGARHLGARRAPGVRPADAGAASAHRDPVPRLCGDSGEGPGTGSNRIDEVSGCDKSAHPSLPEFGQTAD